MAEDLEEYEQWRPLLHDLGACEVKHGVRVSVVNLYGDQVGNATTAEKVSNPEEAQHARPLGGDRCGVARARGDRRWHRNVFAVSDAIAAGVRRKNRSRCFRSKT